MELMPAYESLDDVEAAAQAMRAHHATGATLAIERRLEALGSLHDAIKAHEGEILDALRQDLGKAPFEGYATELGIVYDEIGFCKKRLRSWMRPRRVATPIVHFPSSSKVYPSPLGTVLVLAPWNYPVQLALTPLVDALAAGNCVAVKPSRTSAATSEVICRLIGETFPPEFVCAFPGSDTMNDWLLETRWDHIFFTGSPGVGRTVMQAAAKHLTPVTLELGGKSPCIVDAAADVGRAAQRIAWGKGINSGQTCVAPDYLLAHRTIAHDLIRQLDECFHRYYGADILGSDEWPRIVSKRHFDRLCNLIDQRNDASHVAFGGRGNEATLKIEPTCITGVTLDDPVMQEEIFGPILPVIEYDDLDEALAFVAHFEKPLATYVFSEDKAVWQRVIREVPFGGATINDVVIHLANNRMGFGGVGESGMGAYHGKTGFDCFTHYKSTLRKSTLIEVPVRVPPFGNKIALLRKLMK